MMFTTASGFNRSNKSSSLAFLPAKQSVQLSICQYEAFQTSKAVKLLRKKLCDGDIPPTDNPKSVWKSDPVFMAHKLDNFKTKFNKIKAGNDQQDGACTIFFLRLFIFICRII